MRKATLVVVVAVALGLGPGCGDDGDGLAGPADDEAPAPTEAGAEAETEAEVQDGDRGGDVDRVFAGECPTAEDVGERLGHETTFEPELTLEHDPTPEVECHYDFGRPGSDGGNLEGFRQRMEDLDQAAFAFEGWAEMEVDGDVVIAVDPLDLGDEAVRITYDNYAIPGGDAHDHNLDVVVRTADRLCRVQLDSSAPTPEAPPGRYETVEYLAGTICA